MKLIINWKYIVAFIALNMIMGELHEQAHIITGYFICGCYGSRDISVWSTCEQCSNPAAAYWATAVGPLFSYAMMWLGAYWITRERNFRKRALGFSLVLANLPFARIFTAIMGGGDEKVFIHHLIGEDDLLLARIIAIIITMLICLPPVIMVASKLRNRRSGLIIAGFLILPLFFGLLYQRMFLNGLLAEAVAPDTIMLGTPNLILLHFVLMLGLLIAFRKNLVTAFVNGNK